MLNGPVIRKRGLTLLQITLGPEFSVSSYHLVNTENADFKVESALRFICLKRRLFDHADLANFRVESSLARGSPDAATSTWWDLGR
ncbi:hypothetical protein V1478_015099 [Vespula squamosa]|uniref:Uncharacterized protein n=1 Tax=Vespula squamosa TaxID=30214 RepID=A0ABD2A4X0_VESSQ